MLNKTTLVVVLLLALSSFFSCAKRDFKLLSEKNMVDIITELYITEGTLDVLFIRDEQKKNLYYTNLFQKYNTTRSDFEKSAAYYARDAKKWEGINETVLDSLKAKDALIKNNYYHPEEVVKAIPKTQIDTINIWTAARKVVWHPDSVARENKLPFEFLDSNYFAKGDKFVLYFLQSTARVDSIYCAYANMYVRYSNNDVDSVEAMLIPDERVRRYTMAINNPDSLRPVAVYGNLLQFDSIKGTPDRWFDSIAILRIFDSMKNPLPETLDTLFFKNSNRSNRPKIRKRREFDLKENKIELKKATL